jgi:ubiquinone/menaquinone biosynthesis C-methylase UbiE
MAVLPGVTPACAPTAGQVKGSAVATGSEPGKPPANAPANRDPHGPADLQRHIRWLESTERLDFQKPDAVIAALGLAPDAVVADIGCGPGIFARRLARAVPRGVVYAVDVEPQQLYRLQEHLAADGIDNVVPVLASLDDPHLPPGRVDLILVVDTYHHLERRDAYLQTLARALTSEGRLVIVDYFKHALPVGPPPEHKIARATVLAEVEAAGYRLLAAPTFLPYQYFLIFATPGPPAASRR